jgi:chromosome segregation ATPase
MRLSGAIVILTLISAAAPAQNTAPPARRTQRRRAPKPDPEKEALRKSLADATATITSLESRVLDLTAETASLHQKLDADAAATAELQRKLDEANATATSLQARLKTSEERADKLKIEKEQAQKLAAQPPRRTPSPQEVRLEAQLQDITRRRDAAIASILRRYRDLANEYRSFGTDIALPNDREAAPKSGPELTRIQNTITTVEEDLRQLTGLEAQAALVRKSLEKIRKP